MKKKRSNGMPESLFVCTKSVKQGTKGGGGESESGAQRKEQKGSAGLQARRKQEEKR